MCFFVIVFSSARPILSRTVQIENESPCVHIEWQHAAFKHSYRAAASIVPSSEIHNIRALNGALSLVCLSVSFFLAVSLTERLDCGEANCKNDNSKQKLIEVQIDENSNTTMIPIIVTIIINK